VILVENFDPDYVLFERATRLRWSAVVYGATLGRAELSVRFLWPVRPGSHLAITGTAPRRSPLIRRGKRR
jgi:hypothetical protein